jgi:hypothetical protein
MSRQVWRSGGRAPRSIRELIGKHHDLAIAIRHQSLFGAHPNATQHAIQSKLPVHSGWSSFSRAEVDIFTDRISR